MWYAGWDFQQGFQLFWNQNIKLSKYDQFYPNNTTLYEISS